MPTIPSGSGTPAATPVETDTLVDDGPAIPDEPDIVDDLLGVPATPAAAAAESPAAAPAAAQPTIRAETVVAATWDALSHKKARTDITYINTQDADGRPVRLELHFTAISGPAYDKLMDAHPAKPSQQAKGFAFNPETFPAALLEAVCDSPKLPYDKWLELSKDPAWSGGEFGGLFSTAQRCCIGGLDIPFTGLG